eukprot:365812-Chlamydomonas_euryale.AAC.7
MALTHLPGPLACVLLHGRGALASVVRARVTAYLTWWVLAYLTAYRLPYRLPLTLLLTLLGGYLQPRMEASVDRTLPP